MTAFHHYELLCDAPGCAATFNAGEVQVGPTRRRAAQIGWVTRIIRPAHGGVGRRTIDLCPDHPNGDQAIPEAGVPLPAVCVDEVALSVGALREIRACLAERIRWFEARGYSVPTWTRQAAANVDEAIRYAAGAVADP